MSNKVKIVIGIILGVLISVGFIVGVVKNNNSNKVKFEDPEMGKLLIKVSGVKEAKKFREDDLDKITELNIGCVEHYSTLQDIKKCKNLKNFL